MSDGVRVVYSLETSSSREEIREAVEAILARMPAGTAW